MTLAEKAVLATGAAGIIWALLLYAALARWDGTRDPRPVIRPALAAAWREAAGWWAWHAPRRPERPLEADDAATVAWVRAVAHPLPPLAVARVQAAVAAWVAAQAGPWRTAEGSLAAACGMRWAG